jgi:tetratricopeptide (TPR) repeat protein
MQDLRKGIELANRYTLVRKLGAGGAAQTWLAQDRLTKASVALKVLVSERTSGDDFRQEWQTSIRLMHAHIVRVFEFHDDPEGKYFSLQYVDGPDISVLSGAPVDHILAPIALVTDALRYAHARGVVHRDVKASNVLVDHNGAPYLIDFGVAADDDQDARGGSLIAASPQSLAGEPPQPADDIFALGGLIYELVSGRSAYSSAATADDIRYAVPGPLQAADGSDVPHAIRQLVASMLDKDAGKRPDAESVVAALRDAGIHPGPVRSSYIGSEEASADEIIEISDTPRPKSRPTAAPGPSVSDGAGIDPKLVGISLAVLIVILIGVIFLLPATVDVDQEQPVAETEAEGSEASEGDKRKRGVGFSENVEDLSGRDTRVQSRADTEAVLGELLSKMETLERRAVQRWGGLRFNQAQSVYAEGDQAYLERDYGLATDKYREAIEIVGPLLDEVDTVFAQAYDDGLAALERADTIEALRQLELAVAISSSHAGAKAGLVRARNLDTVLSLTDQGFAFENELDLDAAQQSFAEAVELDPEWQPAQDGLVRVLAAIQQREFDARMTEGLVALSERDYAGARAAFRMAEQLKPESLEPADGLLQVDQGIRLDRIAALERQAESEKRAEKWETAIETYESILEIDPNLLFAQQGLAESRRMSALHAQIGEYVANPDSLSSQSTMGKATRLVVDITRMPEIGPRLADERDQLSRLLKRAATPLTVQLVSDNITDVSIYKVGKLGSFQTRNLDLRPGTYVAVGSRPGYRDVRLEFRVAPEIDLEPVVVRCEETI